MTRSLVSFGIALWLAACGSHAPGVPAGDGQPDGPPGDGMQGMQTVAPSCIGLAGTCGAGGDDSCCRSLAVPGGTYYRSFDLAGDASSKTMDFPATVSGFRLDKYEVSVGRFRAFVLAGEGTSSSPPPAMAGAHAGIAASGWDPTWDAQLVADTAALVAAVKCNAALQTWTDAPGANEDRPMNCLTWYEAMAFCAWDGGYLPTEAEWNYAATGGDEQRAYPWSSPAGEVTIDGTHASYSDGTSCVGDGIAGCAVTDLVAVGTKPAGDGRWGHSDLAGNVEEWVLDWEDPYPTPCKDCAGLTATTPRVIRGGAFAQPAQFVRTGYRDGFPPANRSQNYGVRCARASIP